MNTPISPNLTPSHQEVMTNNNHPITPPQKAWDEELDRRLEAWWYNEGSGMSPRADEDCEELVRRVSRIAWHNGAYCALAEPEPEKQSALDDVHYEWELEDDEGEWQAGGSANSLEDVQREGMRYLQAYAQEGFHRLIIRHHRTRVIQDINNG